MSLKIVRNDIVKMDTEAIVNTANDHVTVGTGCDQAVYRAAGYDELLAYRQEHIGFVPEGEAFVTPGFQLPAKYIIHAVSPLYEGGYKGEEEKLRHCYRNSLSLAKEHNIKSIAFPLIATGGFGYPKEEGLRIALDEIQSFLLVEDLEVYLVVFDNMATELGTKLYPDLQSYIDHNYVTAKKDEEYSVELYNAMQPPEFTLDEDSVVDDNLALRWQQKSTHQKTMEAQELSEDADLEKCEEANLFSADTFENAEKLARLKQKLDERKAHLADSFSEYLLYIIKSQGKKNVDVYKKAIIDRKLFAKIKNDSTYHPQKRTCLQLCIGAELNLDQAKDLLARAGYALSPCDMRDIIFSFFIENKIYDMLELDIQLEEYGMPCIVV